jgi:hypothetical protein
MHRIEVNPEVTRGVETDNTARETHQDMVKILSDLTGKVMQVMTRVAIPILDAEYVI